MFIMGLSMVISTSSRESFVNLVKNNGVASGLLNLILCIPVVILHNEWAGFWEITITIVGWSGVIKGFLRILNHPTLNKMRNKKLSETNTLIGSWIALIFGCILIYGAYYGQMQVV